MTISLPVLADFNEPDSIEDWRVVDDVVMGGRSDGHFHWSRDGYAIFTGDVSPLEGRGFSSVQTTFKQQDVSDYRHFRIRLKGDSARYQFRVKATAEQEHWFVYEFETGEEWEELDCEIESIEDLKLSITIP